MLLGRNPIQWVPEAARSRVEVRVSWTVPGVRGLRNESQRHDFKVGDCLELGQTSQGKATTLQRSFFTLVEKWCNGNANQLGKKMGNVGLRADFQEEWPDIRAHRTTAPKQGLR